MRLAPYGAAYRRSGRGGFVRQISRQAACAKAPRGAVGPGGAGWLGHTVRDVRVRPIRGGLSRGRFGAWRAVGQRAYPRTRNGKRKAARRTGGGGSGAPRRSRGLQADRAESGRYAESNRAIEPGPVVLPRIGAAGLDH